MGTGKVELGETRRSCRQADIQQASPYRLLADCFTLSECAQADSLSPVGIVRCSVLWHTSMSSLFQARQSKPVMARELTCGGRVITSNVASSYAPAGRTARRHSATTASRRLWFSCIPRH